MFESYRTQTKADSSLNKYLIINSVLLDPDTTSRPWVDNDLILKQIEKGIFSVLKDAMRIINCLLKLTLEHGYSLVLYSNRKEHLTIQTLEELERACRLAYLKSFPKISAIVVKDRAAYPQVKASELKVAENCSHERLVAGYSLQPQQETEILEGISKLINLNDSARNSCIVVDSRPCFVKKAKQEGWNTRDAGSDSLGQILWDLWQEAAKEKEDASNQQLPLNEAKGLVKEAVNQEIAVPLTPFISELEFESLHKPSPGGSSFTRAFTDKESKSEWIGKCSEQAVQSQNEYDEYREYLASQLYELLGVKVPKTLLSRQYFVEKIQKGELWRRCKGAHQPRLHILSQVVPGFELLGKDFLQEYKSSSEKNKKEPFCIGEGKVPLKGFGRMMAVAILTQDYSFIGDPGRNIGYLPKKNGKYFEILKIDLGEALETEENEDIHKPLSKQDAVFGTLKERISYNELNEIDQKEFVQTLKEMLEIKHCTFEKMFLPFVKLDVRFRRAFEEFLNRRQQFLFAFASEVRNLITVQIEELEKQQSEKHDINLEKSPTTTIEKQAHEIEELKKYVSAPVSSIEATQSANQLSKELIELAGELPLAHSLAVAYMQQKGMNISEFCSFISKESSTESILLQTQDKEKELESIADNNEFKSLNFVATLLALTLEDLKLINPQIEFILDVLAYLSPDEISTNMLQELWSSCQSKERLVDSHIQRIDESWKELLHYERTHERECSVSMIEAFNYALKLLLSYSIITVDPIQIRSEKDSMPSEDTSDMKISIHHLIQQLIRLYHRRSGNYDRCYGNVFAWMAMNLVDNERDPNVVKRMHLLVRHAIHLGILPNTINDLEMASFQEKLGNHAQFGIGKYDVAVKCYEKALLLKAKHHSDDHPAIAISLADLGNAWGSLGNFEKQRDVLTQALAIFEKHFGKDHPKVAAILCCLGNGWGGLGDFQKQKDLLTRALEIKEKCYGPDHPEIGIILNNLGNAWGGLGNLEKQKDLLTQALEIREKCYGKDHPEVAITLRGLASAWGSLGNLQKKREVLTQVYAIFEKHYGTVHPQIGTTLLDLGCTWGQLGDFQKQRDLLTQALEVLEKCYGKDHLQITLVLRALGNAWRSLGDFEKQKDLLTQALEIYEKHLPKDHPDIALTLDGLGNAWGSLRNPQKQIEALTQALIIFEKQLGPHHPQTGVTLNKLGNAWGVLRDFQKQIYFLTRALEVLEKCHGKDDPRIAGTLAGLGNAWGSLRNFQKQKDLLTRALEIFEKLPGNYQPQIADVLNNLGNAWGALGSVEKQKDLLIRALETKEKCYGEDHLQVGITLNQLGNVWGLLRDYEKKKELLTRALEILEKRLPKGRPEIAFTLNNLGNVWGTLGDNEKRKELLTRALEILEKLLPKGHPEIAIALNNLGNAWGALGDYEKKKDYLTQALQIFEKHGHPQLSATLHNLGCVWGSLGDHEKKKEFLTRALEIKEKQFGKDHLQIAFTVSSLGNALGALGDYEKQKDVLTRALEIFEKHLPKDHPDIGVVLHNLGNACGRLGDFEKQKDLLTRALEIKEKHNGKGHPKTYHTLLNLGKAWESLGDHEKKNEFVNRALEIKNSENILENNGILHDHLNRNDFYFFLGEEILEEKSEP